jgi:transposase
LGALPKLTEDSRLPDGVRALLLEAHEHFAALHVRLARCDAQIAAHARNSPAAQRAGELLGVGPVTSSALAATVPDARILWAMLAKEERYDASAWKRHPMNQPPLAGNP